MDKTERLLQLTANPELCSDEELQQLLADDECRALYEAMRLSADAYALEEAKAELADGRKEREWQRLFGERSLRSTLHTPLLKIAAMFIGVLMLSGITYAAISIFRNSTKETREQQTEAVVSSPSSTVNVQLADADSTQVKPVVFEDKELGTMLKEMAAFYHCETVYKNEQAKHVRLYFTWDKKKTIDEIVETFNKFERFHITRENQQLIVE